MYWLAYVAVGAFTIALALWVLSRETRPRVRRGAIWVAVLGVVLAGLALIMWAGGVPGSF